MDFNNLSSRSINQSFNRSKVVKPSDEDIQIQEWNDLLASNKMVYIVRGMDLDARMLNNQKFDHEADGPGNRTSVAVQQLARTNWAEQFCARKFGLLTYEKLRNGDNPPIDCYLLEENLDGPPTEIPVEIKRGFKKSIDYPNGWQITKTQAQLIQEHELFVINVQTKCIHVSQRAYEITCHLIHRRR